MELSKPTGFDAQKSMIFDGGQDGAWEKITWKTYQYQKNGKINSNFIKIYMTYYTKNPKTKKYVVAFHDTFTIAKVTKNSAKITDWSDAGIGPAVSVDYEKTKLTATYYYWRVFKHEITPTG
jgi:hypothetical protein